MADELEQLRDEITFAFDIVVSDRCGSPEDAQDVRMWRDKALAIVDEVERLRQRDTEQRQKMWQYANQNDLMRSVVAAVAEAESYHAEIVDVWALVFANPSLSYVQTILREARDAMEQINGDK